MRRSTAFRVALALACVILSSIGASTAFGAKIDVGKNSPLSGAALNLLRAKDPFPAPPAQFGRGPGAYIYSGFVNNPGADGSAQDTQSETSITVKGSKAAIAFNDSGSYPGGGGGQFTGFSASADSGDTWADRGALPPSPDGDAGDPVLATQTDTGAIYLVTLKFNGEGIELFKSTDGGQTFGPPINAVPEAVGTGDFLDKPWIAINNQPGTFHDNVAICYTRFGADGSDQVRVVESPDGGATFGPSVLVNDGGQGCNAVWGNDPHGGGNTLYLSYYQGTGAGGQGGDNKLFVNTYNETGVHPSGTITRNVRNVPAKVHSQVADLNTTTTNGELNLNGGVRSNTFPQAAVNPSNGDVFEVYNDDPTPASNTDNGNIYYVRSTDAGATWSAPALVNSDTARDQFFPSLALTSTGSAVGFGYYSRANDSANLMFHREGRQALVNAGGSLALSATTSYQLGPDTPLAFGQDPVVNGTYMGDYDQVVASSAAFYESWSDNRAGNAFHQYQPDVHFARVNAAKTNADVAVTATATPTTVTVGHHTSIKVVTSSLTGDARDVWVHVNPAAGLKFASVSGSGCRMINQFIDCPLGNVDHGTSRSFTIDAIALTPAGTRKVKAVSTASTHDTATGNNADSVTITTTGSGTSDVFTTGNIATPIPDVSTVDIPITVPSGLGPVLHVRPGVRLNHTFDSDLVLTLIDPSGTAVELSSNNGGSGNDYGSGATDCTGTRTTFDDGYPTPITAGTAPFAGGFKPEGTLANMAGDPTAGTWKLRVRDVAAADTGTVYCVKLQLSHP